MVALLDLLDELPPTSRLYEAIVNDPDEAARIVEAERKQPKREFRPSTKEYGLLAVYLAEVREAVLSVRAAVYTVNKVKPPPVAPLPGPETEVSRLRELIGQRAQLSIIEQFAPTWARKE